MWICSKKKCVPRAKPQGNVGGLDYLPEVLHDFELCYRNHMWYGDNACAFFFFFLKDLERLVASWTTDF